MDGLGSSSDFLLFLPPYQAFRIILSAPITIGISVTIFHIGFLVPWQGLNTCLFIFFYFNHTSQMHQGGLQWCAVFIADFGLFLHHISSDSNPGLTLKEPSRLRDRDVLRSCLYQSKEKINKKPDFGRSYKHLSFSKQPMKTRHSTLLCYIIPSLSLLLLLLLFLWERFTLALADGFSLSDWQVSSSLQDSSQYSGRS